LLIHISNRDYSHEGLGFTFKKWQADNVMKIMSSEQVEHFKKDENAGKNKVKEYGSGTGEAPKGKYFIAS